MPRGNKCDCSVFHFVLVARSGSDISRDVGALRGNSRAIVFQDIVVAKRRIEIEVVLAGVGLRSHELVMPVWTRRKSPAKIRAEYFLAIALGEIRRREQGCTGNAGAAGVVPQREMNLIGIGKEIAKVPAYGAIQ